MISLYRRTVYRAWVLRSREGRIMMTSYTLASHVYDTLRVLPGMRGEDGKGWEADIWWEIWDIAYEI